MRECEVRRLHLVTYENGMAMQETLVAKRQRNEIADQLLLLEHTPVITLGRGGDMGNLLAPKEVFSKDGIRFFETTRGGDITYHGPGQLVGYPILHLGEGNRDVRKYVTNLEETIIRTVAEWGIVAAREEGKRGVWVGRDKVAAIGVRVARWVTCHGFALNVTTNLDHFRYITPCGIAEGGVTSLERLLGKAPPMREVIEAYLHHFADVFGREPVERGPEIRLVKVVPHDGGNVLLLRRDPARGEFWQPVTGRIEPGETPAAAARRELLEETGCDAVPRELGLRQSFLIDPAFLPAPAERLPFVDEISYEAELPAGCPIRLSAGEHQESRWMSFEEAYRTIRWTDDRESLERVEALLKKRAAV
ncbi:MAG TPA: lipoyl(octanoyl) transferase LipB [Thermoanaerobaculia bacterium]